MNKRLHPYGRWSRLFISVMSGPHVTAEEGKKLQHRSPWDGRDSARIAGTRAEKTEVLSDDLLTKKLPLMGVSQSLNEGCGQLSDETLLGKTLNSCGDAELRLAQELSQHEFQIEKDVLEPLNQLTEVDIPNIQKQRKQLAKLVLDMDSARGRYNQAQKSSSTNFQMQPGKLDSLREEMEEAENKVEQCKDQLAADMYNFLSKEGEYGLFFVTLLEAQAEYHRRALSVLEKALPEIQAQQDKWTEKPAFGTALEEHLKRSSRDIAVPIEACVMMLLETGMKEEGLFRIAAGASKLKKLKAALDCSTSHLEEFYSDPHAVAGALKSYLRELPEPLMTFALYEEWIAAGNVQDQNTKLQNLWVVCQKLPKTNFENFRYLVKFLAKLSQSSDVNKMTPSNIAIVLGPNLLWSRHEGTLAEMAAATSVHVVTIIEPIIQHADWFFPEELDFNVSGAFAAAAPAAHQNNDTAAHYEFGLMERKRPVSMAVMDGDLLKKDNEGGPPAESIGNATDAATANSAPVQPVASTDPAPTHGQEEPSSNKTKETPTATTPPSLRNGTHPPSGGNTNQFAAVPAQQGTANPSPHSSRRATKKPAPAPPKPAMPPPFQPVTQNLPVAASAPPSVLPKPSNHNAIPPSITSNQGGSAAPSAFSYGTLPRRHSGSQPIIQAPNHPPPQPPTQPTPQPKPTSLTGAAPTAPSTDQSSSPSQSPTPPDTPPPLTDHPSLPDATLTSAPNNTGTLTRQRPVPKPRVRPTVPPPPQPPITQPSVEAPPGSKVVTDPVSGHLLAESVGTVPIVDPHPLPVVLLDTDVESTAL
ncbi:unnamed protein product [Ranitomeya imitator]|uniref:Rho GTPase-activating protein 17 n=1 Tax=Ranitomeya imitator TaxID=111125 RepID=A0ABN9KM85_9NEOB|nr:unnamed protein product [Ranitomeya imitator]